MRDLNVMRVCVLVNCEEDTWCAVETIEKRKLEVESVNLRTSQSVDSVSGILRCQ